MDYGNLTDDSLIDLLKRDDGRAFELIYRRYWRQLYSFVYQQLGSKEDAEEIIHDLMLSFWKNRNQSEIRNLKLYFFISARNLVNKCIKSQINLRRYREYQIMHEVYETQNNEHIIDASQLTRAIEEALNRLPEKTAAIFRMSKIEEMPIKKIAEKLNLSDKAIEYHLTKSIKMLRQCLHGFHSDN